MEFHFLEAKRNNVSIIPWPHCRRVLLKLLSADRSSLRENFKASNRASNCHRWALKAVSSAAQVTTSVKTENCSIKLQDLIFVLMCTISLHCTCLPLIRKCWHANTLNYKARMRRCRLFILESMFNAVSTTNEIKLPSWLHHTTSNTCNHFKWKLCRCSTSFLSSQRLF